MKARKDSINPNKIVLPKDYVPDKIRLEEMIESLETQGMYHTPIVKEDMSIVAGKLRVKAAQQANILNIEVLIVPVGLTDDDYLEVSLNENLRRGSSWDQICINEKIFHELRLRQAGVDEAKKGKKSAWGLRQTAEELKISLGGLAEDIQLANALLLDPSLARVKDKATAKKIIAEAIKRSSQELGANRPVSVETNLCLNGDAGVILKMYPDDVFDACITDPPWLEFRDPTLTRDEFTLPVFKQIYRVLKSNSFLYVFVSTQDFEFYFAELPKIGFSVQKWPLLWIKEGHLSHGRRTWEYQRDYEPILLAVKGSPALTNNFVSSVIINKIVPSGLLIHPNEKPVQVMNRLLDHCSYEGSMILDPFAGSGATLVACSNTRRRYVGVERDSKYFEKIQERLKK